MWCNTSTPKPKISGSKRGRVSPLVLLYLLRFAELLDNLGGHLKVLQKVIGHSITDP